MTITQSSPTAHAVAVAVGPSLSAAMREGSQLEHEAAESSVFMAELLAGRISEDGYAAYLRRLRVVYAALETAVREHAAEPLVGAVHDPALERLKALDADLAYWAPGTAHDVDSPAASAYAERLRAAGRAAEEDGGGALAAHHYTRYLGDLSGGQAIGRILAREFGLVPGPGGAPVAGLTFYAFAEIPKPKPYKDAYRARLDALPLTESAVTDVVAEVKIAFGHNQALFAELGREIIRLRR